MIKTVFIFQTQISAIVVLNFILVAFKDVCIYSTSYIGVQSLYLLVISCFTVIVTWHVSVFHLVLLLLCHYLYWFHLCLIKFLEYPFGLCELFVFSIQLAVLLCPWISFLLIDFCNSLNNCLDFCLTLATFSPFRVLNFYTSHCRIWRLWHIQTVSAIVNMLYNLNYEWKYLYWILNV